MKSIFAVLVVAFLMVIFTLFVDGEMGVILIAFLVFAPLISLIFMLYSRKKVKVSIDCDGYVKKGSKLSVTVRVEKNGRLPLSIIEIHTKASEVFSQENMIYRLSSGSKEAEEFTYEVDALTGGNGEISITDAFVSGFLGFMRLRIAAPLPEPVSVGVIPEIPELKSSSQLFRNIADVVVTSDEEEENDTSMMFSANTAPGYEHREYVQGDPLKRVNWKLSTKKQKLMVRLDEAVASVQPLIVLDIYRSSKTPAAEAVANEEKLIQSVFGLLQLMIEQGIACGFAYVGQNSETVVESADSIDSPSQFLLKVLAQKVVTDRHIELDKAGDSACACIIASTDFGNGLFDTTMTEDPDRISLLGVSAESENPTNLPLWFLDGDNNFKMV
ncbi:MAG TPA: DUF58 domain-containing protein [Ruminococcus flavefaciens]|nr:DUF58 domain-containing protein [Ruminococcus flavefaciens]